MSIPSILQLLRNLAGLLGRELVEKALTLVNTFLDKRVPDWARALILAALTYLLCPADAIPDGIPVAGFADDLATLAATLAGLSGVVKPKHTRRARQTASDFFA